MTLAISVIQNAPTSQVASGLHDAQASIMVASNSAAARLQIDTLREALKAVGKDIT